MVGIVGYRLSEGMSWIDAFLNAAMLMGGMGPVNVLHSDGAKCSQAFTPCTAGSWN
jgi:hypothetical protein